MNKHTHKSLIASAISLVLLSTSTIAMAEGHAKKAQQEQCAGVVKSGLNDCASQEHACAGLNTEDGYDTDWLWLPKGTCNKISGAHTIASNMSE